MFSRVFKISFFTIKDELAYRSFYLLAAICFLFVYMLRGCFSSQMVVNGQQLSSATIGWQTSLFGFHVITVSGMLIAILMAMRNYKRDFENGTMSAILSKPISRLEYVLGKIAGIWILVYGLTFLLHLSVFLLMWWKTGGRIPYYIPCSLLISINILFVTILVSILSLFFSEIFAALAAIAVCAVSLVSDGVYLAMHSQMVQSMISGQGQDQTAVSLWRILWPKIGALQYYAVSIIQGTPFNSMGSINPVINMAVYCVVVFVALWWRFSKEEVK